MAWSQYVNSSFQVGIIVLCAVLSPIAPLLVGLRLWSRTILRSHLSWGDVLIIIACVWCNSCDWLLSGDSMRADVVAVDSTWGMASHHRL